MKWLLLALLVACGSKAQETSISGYASAPVVHGMGYLLWVKPPPTLDRRDGPPPPQMDPDHWMLMDMATKVSQDLGAAPLSHLTATNATNDVAYLVDYATFVRVRADHGKAVIEPLGGVRDPAALTAVAPDGSTGARVDRGTLCIVKQGTKECAATIALPGFESSFMEGLSYVGTKRIVAMTAEGEQNAHAVGMGMHVRVDVADLATKTAVPLELPAIGYVMFVSPDGRIAWNEAANGRLQLAVATLDNAAVKKTYDLGPAAAQADADCVWGGDRILCVLRNQGALVSIDTHAGVMTTLVPEDAFPKGIVVSQDGHWIVYATTTGRLDVDDFTWFLSPTDRAGHAQRLAFPENVRMLAWLP